MHRTQLTQFINELDNIYLFPNLSTIVVLIRNFMTIRAKQLDQKNLHRGDAFHLPLQLDYADKTTHVRRENFVHECVFIVIYQDDQEDDKRERSTWYFHRNIKVRNSFETIDLFSPRRDEYSGKIKRIGTDRLVGLLSTANPGLPAVPYFWYYPLVNGSFHGVA